MTDDANVEQAYLPPSHLRTQQTMGPFPARFIMPLMYGMAIGAPLAFAAYHATGGLLPPAIGADLIPPLLMAPLMAWWLTPPAEHGIGASAAFMARTYHTPSPPAEMPIAVYRMPTLNLETADAATRQTARAQWGSILNELTHPIKIVIRSRPLTTLPVINTLIDHPKPEARRLGKWFEDRLTNQSLVERDRLLVVPAADETELRFRTEALEKALRRARLEGMRIPADELGLLRTLTYNPNAAESQPIPEQVEEGWTEANADGWWTRAYALGKLPPSILTNWASPLLAGDETIDVAIDIEPQDIDYVKTWVLDVRINQMLSSVMDVKRSIALEQLQALRQAFERRRVAPFEVAITVLVRGTTQKDVQERSRRVEDRVRSTGAQLNVLRWEQAAGLRQLDPATTKPMRGRTHLIETGTLARTYPWSDGYLQLPGGVPWGEAGNRLCLFTPFVKGNRGPHMAWYGTTNAGKGMAAHLLWSRLHLIQGVRIFGIDADEQQEHCGRFLEYLHGRKERPRTAEEASKIVLRPDDGVVILDLSEVDDDRVGGIFAAWSKVVKAHMLRYPGKSILFVDEAVTVSEDPDGERAMRDAANRSRHWGQSFHVITQRPSTWFGTAVGRAIQGNADAWWCGAQQPRELAEVAEALELTDEERTSVRKAGIGTGLLFSGGRRVWHDLFDKMAPSEYEAFHSDPVEVGPVVVPIRKEGVA